MVDAKQRAILSAKAAASGVDRTRFCAEPSPDVFAVIAQALSAGASFGRGGDPKAVEAALKAAFSSSEQGSTIPRTQTTNTLRELMYRTCERYLNGGIDGVELSLQAVRDQRLIVPILAIEGLTGAVAARAVVIGATAAGSSGQATVDLAARLDDQNKLVVKRTETLGKQQAALEELNGKAKDCDAIAKAVADKQEAGLSQALKDKKTSCEATAAAVDTAKKDKASAEAHYKALLGLAGADGQPVAASGTLMTPVAGASLDSAARTDIAQVAQAVQHIVDGTFNQDEYLFLCLKVAQSKPTDQLAGAQGACLDYIKSRVDVERAENERKVARIEAAAGLVQQRVDRLFDQFWARVSTRDLLDSAKLAALQKAIAPEDWPSCFAQARSKADHKRCFDSNDIAAAVKRQLAKGPTP